MEWRNSSYHIVVDSMFCCKIPIQKQLLALDLGLRILAPSRPVRELWRSWGGAKM
jgi:hypothetical protein